jgi:hypothetical protein
MTNDLVWQKPDPPPNALRTAFTHPKAVVSMPAGAYARYPCSSDVTIWRLVETAWSLDVSPRLLVARYDLSTDGIYVEASDARRIGVTSCRDALNGYQKGKCFYCSSDIRQPRLVMA